MGTARARHRPLPRHRDEPEEPCRSVPRRPRAARLGCAFDAHQVRWPEAVAAIRPLALTGCRRGEVHDLRRRDVGEGALNMRDSKTGARSVPLGEVARAHIAALPGGRDPDARLVEAAENIGDTVAKAMALTPFRDSTAARCNIQRARHGRGGSDRTRDLRNLGVRDRFGQVSGGLCRSRTAGDCRCRRNALPPEHPSGGNARRRRPSAVDSQLEAVRWQARMFAPTLGLSHRSFLIEQISVPNFVSNSFSKGYLQISIDRQIFIFSVWVPLHCCDEHRCAPVCCQHLVVWFVWR